MAAQAQGRLHDVFLNVLADLVTAAGLQADAERGEGDRPWQVPREVDDVRDVPGITAGFDRDEANANFEALLADQAAGGTAGDAIGVKVQVDAVAVWERGFRARHCSSVRCRALASGRRRAHGLPAGVFGGVIGYAQDAIKAGRS